MIDRLKLPIKKYKQDNFEYLIIADLSDTSTLQEYKIKVKICILILSSINDSCLSNKSNRESNDSHRYNGVCQEH